MGSYPIPEHNTKMYGSMVEALGMKVSKIEEDNVAVQNFLNGKTESDILSILKGEKEDEKLSPFFKDIREDSLWFYSRPFGIGLFSVMRAVGVELTLENVDKWFATLNIKPGLPRQDLDIYTTSLLKLKQAEQMFKEIEIREKKAMAKRLEEKAQRALDMAEKAAQKAAEAK